MTHLIERRLSTEISSSIDGQWMPIPPPIRRHLARCRGLAFRRRGNQSMGTETSRPSASMTVSESEVQDTFVANGSTFTAKVFIPSPSKFPAADSHDLEEFCYFIAPETSGPGESDRLEPKFSIFFSRFNMHVWRLFPVETEEEEPPPLHSQNRWHRPVLYMNQTRLQRTS